EDEPDWQQLPPSVPAAIRKLLQRCLQKDTRQRLQDATDVRIALEDGALVAAGLTPASAPQVRRRTVSVIASSIAAAMIAIVAIWNLKPSSARLAEPMAQMVIPLPASETLVGSEHDSPI